MSRPDKLPSWADDDDSAKVTEPSDTKKLQGWIYKERVPFDFWNWLLRHFVKWVTHFDVSLNHFDPRESAAPVMNVYLTAGRVQNGITLTEIAAQTTSTITAPSANPRIDRVVIDNVTGVVSVVAGAEAASPSAPAITLGKIAIAQVLLQTTSTSITSSMITDERGTRYMPLIDEDSMSSNSNKAAPTQQSAKAYADASLVAAKAYADVGDTLKGALVYKSSALDITGGASHDITFSDEDYDTDSIHDEVSNTEILTVPSGVTSIKLKTQIAAESTIADGGVSSAVFKNGSPTFVGGAVSSIRFDTANDPHYAIMSTPPINVTGGDEFKIQASESSTGTVLILSGLNRTWFSMEIIK